MSTYIHYERTGGFAGLKLATSFELDDLNDEQGKQLAELLDDLDFFDLPDQILPPRPGARSRGPSAARAGLTALAALGDGGNAGAGSGNWIIRRLERAASRTAFGPRDGAIDRGIAVPRVGSGG